MAGLDGGHFSERAAAAQWSGKVNHCCKYHCNYCLADCSGLRVKCADCLDFDLCLQCFASGAEMGTHKRDHGYQLMDNGTFSLICEDWGADEESLLLDAIEQHGFGNWDDIADHIGTKTPQEAQEHYEETFLKGNIGSVTLPRRLAEIQDHTTTEDGRLSPCLTHPPEPLELPVSEQQELGYMPYRDDFEREFDNEAESLIKCLACNRDDDELETALKLAQVDMYWRTLKERNRRKSIARQHGLITSKHKLIASRRKLMKEDREFKDKIRPFAQLLTADEWEELITNRIREKEIRSRVKELVRYRKNGIKKLAACQEFDELRYRREKRKENKKRMQVTSPPRTTKVSSNRKESPEEEKVSPVQESAVCEPDFRDTLKNDTCYHLISEKEKQLCCAIRMKCSRYLTVKGIILKDQAARRQGLPPKTRYPPYLTKPQKKAIAEYLHQAGWYGEQ